MAEQWRSVEGFPGYLVSDAGRVVGRRGHVLSPHGDSTGRQQVDLKDGSRRRMARVHTLVLEAFVGSMPPGMEASHLNGDASDNRLANLRWESHSANVLRKQDHGTEVHGEACNLTKLSESAIRAIREACAQGELQRDIAERFNTTQGNVSAIVLRKSWRHVA